MNHEDDPVAVLTTILCAALALAMALVLRSARKQARGYAVQVRWSTSSPVRSTAAASRRAQTPSCRAHGATMSTSR